MSSLMPVFHMSFNHIQSQFACAAVLRRLLRELEGGTLARPPMPSPNTPPQEAAEKLAVATSHPTWMVLRWLQRLGQAETLLLLEHNNRSLATLQP